MSENKVRESDALGTPHKLMKEASDDPYKANADSMDSPDYTNMNSSPEASPDPVISGDDESPS